MKRLLGLLLGLCFAVSVHAQDNGNGATSLRVFLDCSYFCDDQFIKDELPIVDFLNERTQADVHILYASQSTGSGGSRVTLTFLGQRMYSDMVDTLYYATSGDATRDDERRALLHNLALGLSRYLAKAGMGDKLNITAVKPSSLEPAANSIEEDPWDYWVFSISGSGSLNGEESTKFTRKNGSFSANRTTEDLKIRFSGNARESISEYKYDGETTKSTTTSESLNGQVVKSIGKQWSIGAVGSVSASSYQNAKLRLEIGPALEYDFFPYTESTRKYLTLQYRITVSQNRYDELTIFALQEETILRHSLELSLSLSQKWGSVSLSGDLSHLLTNFDRSLTDSYNLGVFASANVRLFRGFSFNTFASYNRIRDQIDLPAAGATKEEILLQSIRLPTGYSYNLNFGFTYRFGSIFNNVVNPRMGGGGGGGMIIMM